MDTKNCLSGEFLEALRALPCALSLEERPEFPPSSDLSRSLHGSQPSRMHRASHWMFDLMQASDCIIVFPSRLEPFWIFLGKGDRHGGAGANSEEH